MTRLTLAPAFTLVLLTAACAHAPRRSPARDLAAECSLLDIDLYEDSPVVQRRFRKKYGVAYREILKPGYRFKIAGDAKLRTRVLRLAMAVCRDDIRCLGDFVQLAARAEASVRSDAIGGLATMARENVGRSEEIYRAVLGYLESDVPTAGAAQMLSVMAQSFNGKELTPGVLRALEKKSVGNTEAARFLARALKVIKANKNRLKNVGFYPLIDGAFEVNVLE